MKTSLPLLATLLLSMVVLVVSLSAGEVCAGEGGAATPDGRSPRGRIPTESELAPYGRTPGGSARLTPGPQPVVGIDPNDHDQTYLEYLIPKNAVKGKPFQDRGDDRDIIEYFDPATHQLVAAEWVLAKDPRRRDHTSFTEPTWKMAEGLLFPGSTVPKPRQIVRRELFRDGKRHGIQREWYDNGAPKSEGVFKNGIMHGLFRYWDNKGNLVGCFRITNGAGVEKIYYPNGRLLCERHYRENVENGPSVDLYDNGQVESVSDKVDGRLRNGLNVAFHSNGAIADVRWCNHAGTGVGARFSPEGALEGDVYYLIGHPMSGGNGNPVTKEQYIAQTKADPTLPKVERDPQRYKTWVDEKTKKIVAEYKAMPPVKIPLDCKDEPAPKPEQPKPKAAK